MRAFADLYVALDETTKTNEKVAHLARYLSTAEPADAAWAVNFLIGRRPKRLLESRKLVEWAIEETGVPEWLLAECQHAVGDFAEVIALLLPPVGETPPQSNPQSSSLREAQPDSAGTDLPPHSPDHTESRAAIQLDSSGTMLPLHYWVEQRLLPMRDADDETRRAWLLSAWRQMNERQRFAWNKLITGEFRVGVSQSLVVRALAEVSGVSGDLISHRLMGDWQPTPAFWRQLVSGAGGPSEIAAHPSTTETSSPESTAAIASSTASGTPTSAANDFSKPYPFFLAYPIEGDIEQLGQLADWQVEWKWDGIRAQLIRRHGQTYLWSRGEELMTGRFPELDALAEQLPDGTVIDGEVLPWKNGEPLPFAQMQRRIGRKVLSARILAEVPVVLMGYDLLEIDGADSREQPIEWRRAKLETIVPAGGAMVLSPVVNVSSWDSLKLLRQESRGRKVEGFMLKRRGSPYRVGRRRGDWWKWKIQPYSVDAVLIYAQPGSGRRASLFTDYTFGVWDDGKLVPFAKAYSGLTDDEIREVDAFVRRNTIEKFGPVHRVKPDLVFELAFEGIQLSTRHRSGIAVRFPRMARWRHDKKPEEADSIETIRALIK